MWRFVKADKPGGFVGRDAVVARKDTDPLVLVGVLMDDKRIVRDQREILTATHQRPLEEIPQLWALYKEVQGYYERGMRVPDDVILLW